MVGVGVDELVNVLTSPDSRAIRAYPTQCSRLRHRRSTCTLCADACPVQAIGWEDSLHVDEERCTACGACATVCPTGALEAQRPTNGELLARIEALARERTSVAFACPRYLAAEGGDGQRFVRVQCLARLDEGILTGAVAVGMHDIWLMDGSCQECPQAANRAIIEQTVMRSNALLEALGLLQRIVIASQLPPELHGRAEPRAVEDTSRRAFFTLLARQTARTAAETVKTMRGEQGPETKELQEPRKGELPVRLPARHQILLAGLARLAGRAACSPKIDGGLFAQFGVKEKCTACQMCAFFCPTGALTKVEQDGRAGISFRVAYCVDCGLCRDVCYRDAVVLSGSVGLDRVLGNVTQVVLMQDACGVPGQAPSGARVQKLQEAMHFRNQ
ncbi:MAG TPA: 4Fe-4S binding protein [Anaerolineae bacterium]|nr:4Fe-4S binding protein [Anaerolineae bacterium]